MAEATLAFFREELTGVSLTVAERIQNVHRLRFVASSVGPDVCRTELLALLKESQEQHTEEDEFQFALAEELSTLCSFLGGEEQFYRVLPLLQNLATAEETAVREKAVESVSRIVEKLRQKRRQKFVSEYIFPFIEKLAKAEWFTSRVSACGLIPIAYQYTSDPMRTDLRKLYSALCHDDTPMVRRAAASKLPDIFRTTDKDDLLNNFLLPSNGIFSFFWNEDMQDVIRSYMVEAAVEAVKHVTNDEERLTFLASRIKSAASDRSWRMRLAVAKSIDKLVAGHAPCLLDPICYLLQDPEQDVRLASLTQLGLCMKDIPSGLLETHVVPAFRIVVTDMSQPVRAALATVVGKVAIQLGKEKTEQLVLTYILNLLKDDYQDVRLNMVRHAGEICVVLGMDTLTRQLVQSLQTLMSDPQWRIRLSVVEQIPSLAKHFGQAAYLTIEKIYLRGLTDNVNEVRQCAIDNAKVLSEIFGVQWTLSTFLPQILETKPISYLSRITILRTLLSLSKSSCLTIDQIEDALLPLITAAMLDEVPNVRFASAKIVGQLIETHSVRPAYVEAKFRPALTRLLADEDLDVRYFARKSLLLIEKVSR